MIVDRNNVILMTVGKIKNVFQKDYIKVCIKGILKYKIKRTKGKTHVPFPTILSRAFRVSNN